MVYLCIITVWFSRSSEQCSIFQPGLFVPYSLILKTIHQIVSFFFERRRKKFRSVPCRSADASLHRRLEFPEQERFGRRIQHCTSRLVDLANPHGSSESSRREQSKSSIRSASGPRWGIQKGAQSLRFFACHTITVIKRCYSDGA